MNHTLRWHEEILKEAREIKEVAPKIKNLVEQMEEYLWDIEHAVCYEGDAKEHLNDIKKGIFLPLWNKLSEISPSKVESWCEKYFVIFIESFPSPIMCSWNGEKEIFEEWDGKQQEWVTITDCKHEEVFWIPITYPIIY